MDTGRNQNSQNNPYQDGFNDWDDGSNNQGYNGRNVDLNKQKRNLNNQFNSDRNLNSYDYEGQYKPEEGTYQENGYDQYNQYNQRPPVGDAGRQAFNNLSDTIRNASNNNDYRNKSFTESIGVVLNILKGLISNPSQIKDLVTGIKSEYFVENFTTLDEYINTSVMVPCMMKTVVISWVIWMISQLLNIISGRSSLLSIISMLFFSVIIVCIIWGLSHVHDRWKSIAYKVVTALYLIGGIISVITEVSALISILRIYTWVPFRATTAIISILVDIAMVYINICSLAKAYPDQNIQNQQYQPQNQQYTPQNQQYQPQNQQYTPQNQQYQPQNQQYTPQNQQYQPYNPGQYQPQNQQNPSQNTNNYMDRFNNRQ